jgi:hypothetical protein
MVLDVVEEKNCLGVTERLGGLNGWVEGLLSRRELLLDRARRSGEV